MTVSSGMQVIIRCSLHQLDYRSQFLAEQSATGFNVLSQPQAFHHSCAIWCAE